jgi:alpha-glucosidase
VEDEFMFGEHVLVAPVLERGRDTRLVYLPDGDWIRFGSSEALTGGRAHPVEWPLGCVPAFVRRGAILPLLAPVTSTRASPDSDITFRVYGETATGCFHEDDGLSRGVLRGEYDAWALEYADGRFRAEPRSLGFSRRSAQSAARRRRRYYIEAAGQRTTVELPRSFPV